MTDPRYEKSWWQSKTIVAGLVTVLASLLGIFGITLDQGLTVEVVMASITAVSGAYAIYGRIVADKKIRK